MPDFQRLIPSTSQCRIVFYYDDLVLIFNPEFRCFKPHAEEKSNHVKTSDQQFVGSCDEYKRYDADNQKFNENCCVPPHNEPADQKNKCLV